MAIRRAGGRALSLLLALTLLGTSCSSLNDIETGAANNGDTSVSSDDTEAADASTDAPEDADSTDQPEADPATEETTDEPDPNNGDTNDGDTNDANTADADGDAEQAEGAEDPEAAINADLPEIDVLRVAPRVIGTYPHDSNAFTQGLEFDGDTLIESTGLYGESDRRRVRPGFGAIQATEALSAEEFGQGLTIHDGKLIQLTWKENFAIIADPVTLEETSRIPYDAEGWGICSLGDRIVTSDGTDKLQYRDPEALSLITELSVTLDRAPLSRLNELECIDGLIWANVWLTADIVQIDPVSGQVLTVIDASAIVPQGLDEEEVLNGIAFHRTARTMFITGKRWDVTYELEYPFEDAPAAS